MRAIGNRQHLPFRFAPEFRRPRIGHPDLISRMPRARIVSRRLRAASAARVLLAGLVGMARTFTNTTLGRISVGGPARNAPVLRDAIDVVVPWPGG